MKNNMRRIINGITIYRLITAPLLVVVLFMGKLTVFKFGLLISFATDAVDGSLARHYHATSRWGAKLDSIADDLTVVAGLTGILLTAPIFLREHWIIVSTLGIFYVTENLAAWIRYGRLTAFHTWLAKIAAILQALFLLSFFFYGLLYPLFYLAAWLTALDLAEEILMVLILKNYHTDVSGVFHAHRIFLQEAQTKGD